MHNIHYLYISNRCCAWLTDLVSTLPPIINPFIHKFRDEDLSDSPIRVFQEVFTIALLGLIMRPHGFAFSWQ